MFDRGEKYSFITILSAAISFAFLLIFLVIYRIGHEANSYSIPHFLILLSIIVFIVTFLVANKLIGCETDIEEENNSQITDTEELKEGVIISICAMVFGILSLVIFWIYVGFAFSVIGFILSMYALHHKCKGRGMAICGAVTSVISFVISILHFSIQFF